MRKAGFYKRDWFIALLVAAVFAAARYAEAPWLERLNRLLRESERVVLACSALKHGYRERLREGLNDGVGFVYLHAGEELLLARLKDRRGHYMPASLLASQLEALEVPGPQEALRLDAGTGLGDAVIEVSRHFGLKKG